MTARTYGIVNGRLRLLESNGGDSILDLLYDNVVGGCLLGNLLSKTLILARADNEYLSRLRRW